MTVSSCVLLFPCMEGNEDPDPDGCFLYRKGGSKLQDGNKMHLSIRLKPSLFIFRQSEQIGNPSSPHTYSTLSISIDVKIFTSEKSKNPSWMQHEFAQIIFG